MSNSQITLNQFFSAEKELSLERLSMIESSERIIFLKERILKEAKVKWPVAFDIITEKIKDILNISIADIMVLAWSKYRILTRYLDRDKYLPNETVLVPLAEHTIKSEHHPFIEILINGKSVGRIEFLITISLKLEGIILKIQDGKIKEVITGTCKGKGTIKYESHVIWEKATESISLPGSITLGEGIPIEVA